MKGSLIAIEGIDGSGKSTLVKHIENELIKEGRQVVTVITRETEREQIIQTIINSYSLDPHSQAYMFLFQFLHAHKTDRARKALGEGKIVIADRWDLSFLAWHENFGFFSKESNQLREGVSRLAFGELKPNLGIYLDVSVENAIDRRMWRGEIISDLDSEKQFYSKVLSAYKLLTEKYKWIAIDANDSFEQTKRTSMKYVRELIN